MIMSSAWIVFVFSLVMSGVHCGKYKGKEPGYDEWIVCEGNSLEISCEGNQLIRINEAEYGRTAPGSKYCPSPFDRNTHCQSSESTLEITREECDGFSSCTLHANNQVYGDPCNGTHKYLNVSYRCVRVEQNALEKIRVCENEEAKLECPERRKLHIEYANYGRLKGPHVCSFFILTTNCEAEDSSLETVRADCHGKNGCLLKANNHKFGDPCVGTQKYLEVHYRCRKTLG